MIQNKKYFTIVILLIIIFSTFIIFINVFHQNNQPKFESEITPFNFTTHLSWGPYSYNNDLRDYRDYNSSVGLHKGTEVPFYATILPLDNFINNVTYSMNVLQYQDLSGKNSSITISLLSKRIESFTGVTITSSNPVAINTGINKSISGITKIYSYNKDYKDKLLSNSSKIFYYNLFTVQPEPIDKLVKWNYNLSIEVTLSGYEDRPLLNYLRISHGFNSWEQVMFKPLEIMSNNDSYNTRQIYYGPMAQGLPGKSVDYQLIYLDNKTQITRDNLNLHIDLKTTKPAKLDLIFGRVLHIADIYFTFSKSIGYGPLDNSIIDVGLNWQKTNSINVTLLNISTDSYAQSRINTSEGNFSMNTLGYTNITNRTLNFIAVSVENFDENDQWSNWVNMSIKTEWKITNESIRDNKVEMTINTDKKAIYKEFNLDNKNESNNADFPIVVSFMTLVLVTVLKKYKLKG